MIQKTKDYDKFIFLPENRWEISRAHVEFLKKAIKLNNKLPDRPILVNERFEIMDGQHRVLAAKDLGVDIYFEVKEGLKPDDMLAFTKTKGWNTKDYVNFHVRRGREEYEKLVNFSKRYGFSLSVSLLLCDGNSREKKNDFADGKFIFSLNYDDTQLTCVLDTIAYINKIKGFNAWTTSGRCIKGLLGLVSSQGFSSKIWFNSLEKRIDHVGQRAKASDYRKMFLEVYNYGRHTRLEG